ncbi:MAG TPA: [FeFe] hydrogenase H-cluster radical SAM maturase HydE [bacterium]|nr:[FeFe] hydrogenase H-cluster radical SAM maturase HydE [bacterium]
MIEDTIKKLSEGAPVEREEIVKILGDTSDEAMEVLRAAADSVRARAVGDEIHVRSLVEISNYCKKNCSYCGLRTNNTSLTRFRMTDDEILHVVKKEAARGRKTIVVQSGEDPNLKPDRVCKLIREIKDAADIAVTLSLGEYSREDYFRFREAGADRYLLKHETIDPELYAKLHPDCEYSNRIKCIEYLKEAGFQTGVGIMVGLPGQSLESIADDILFMKRIDADMAGIGPFIPSPDTPLAGGPTGDLRLTLNILAVTRLVMPYILLPATTALGTIHPEGQRLGFRFGANVIMVNATPPRMWENYTIYPNRLRPEADEKYQDRKLQLMIESIGRKISTGFGHSARREERG